jgi:Tol biopolymer transport system component
LYEFSLRDGTLREILRFSQDIRGIDWNPEGTLLAYQITTPRLTIDNGQQLTLTASAICLYDSRSNKTSLIRPLGIDSELSAGQSNERVVAWSPDGRSVLIVDTLSSKNADIHVIDQQGKDLVQPRSGTFARWFPNSKEILYKMRDEPNKPGQWSILNLKTGNARRIALQEDTFRPAISLDGLQIAIDDGDATRPPSTYIYHLRKGTIRRLKTGFGAPVWLNANVVAMTAGEPCPRGAQCGESWLPLDRVIGFNMRSMTTQQLRLQTTIPQDSVTHNLDLLIA